MEVKSKSKVKIAPTLRAMKIGDRVNFPIERKQVVETTRTRIQQQLRRINTKFVIRTIGSEIFITRIS